MNGLLILINLSATLIMVGVIWVVQIVHYPLFNQVGADSFVRYHAAHSSLITLVVGPTMVVEAVTTALLLFYRPPHLSGLILWIGAVLLALIWLSTGFVQVAQHTILGAGFDADVHRLLVTTNWIRTLAWSLRGLLMLWVVKGMLMIA
ncbi:MAG: hypothetical protein M3Q45_00280 [Chloroflexota bacterium]|nr:hypothetical protein [Chloroflexota bacterium]